MMIGTGTKGRRSAEGGRGLKSRGGALSRDGATSGGSVLTGGSREAEGDQQGACVDGARATGRDAGAGMGRYGYARRRDARTINSGSGADTDGVQEVHNPLAGARGVCGE